MPTEFKQISEDITQSEASVIFMHGLSGDSFSTWTIAKKPSHFWPQWLDKNFPKLAVFAISYDAEFIGHSQYINQRALNILASLRTREIFQKKPFIFVTHSLGGLVAKQVILSCDSDAGIEMRHQKILEMFRGATFYATPHRGARLAKLANDIFPGAILGKAVSDLASGGSAVDIIHTGYKNWVEQHSTIKHLAYFETKDTAGVKIVDNVSADPGLPGTTPIGLDFNHIDICKLSSINDERYLQIKQFIGDCLAVKQKENLSLPTKAPNLQPKKGAKRKVIKRFKFYFSGVIFLTVISIAYWYFIECSDVFSKWCGDAF